MTGAAVLATDDAWEEWGDSTTKEKIDNRVYYIANKWTTVLEQTTTNIGLQFTVNIILPRIRSHRRIHVKHATDHGGILRIKAGSTTTTLLS